MTSFISGYDPRLDHPHWMIMTFASIHIPGDEESVRHPGHGYGDHYTPVVKYQLFTDQVAWKKEIHDYTFPKFGYPTKFLAAVVTPAKVQVLTSVSVS